MPRPRIYPDNNTRVKEWRRRKKQLEQEDIEDTGLTGYLNKLIRKEYPISYSYEQGWRPEKGNIDILEVEVKKPYPEQSVKYVFNLDVDGEEDEIKEELEKILNE